jgi:DNA recombination protein RmuC
MFFTRQMTYGGPMIVLAVLIVSLLILAGIVLILLRGAKSLDAAALREESERLRADVREQFAVARKDHEESALRLRAEMTSMLMQHMKAQSEGQEKIRETITMHLDKIRTENGAKLEEMRKTVDEKLHDTLEKRLGESFKQVSDRLEQVHKGLGEMQNLATGVGDLKKVLSNVKTRGTWGEIQLKNMLDQVLTADQYAVNMRVKPGSLEAVEVAIKLPGSDDAGPVYLPIDAKFPKEDYERLVDASESGDLKAIDDAAKAIEARIKQEARDIKNKYIDPPHTTDFAIMYLPIEGLYAEVLRRPGLAEVLQREFRVTVAGPTTLAALLNSLQMGFKTLAIQKQSSEVWRVLGAVKKKFETFGDVLGKVKKKIQEADRALDEAQKDSGIMGKKLKSVESLTEEDMHAILGTSLAADDDEPK